MQRRIAWSIAALIGVLLLLLISAGGGLWWSVRSDAGTAWLLSKLPGVQVTGGRGTLLGDFEAERVEFLLPDTGGKVVMSGFGWRGLRILRFPWTESGTLVTMTELHARRVDLQLAETAKKEPRHPPTDLRTPVELDVALLQIGELYTAALGDKPLRGVRAHLHLGDELGKTHRVDKLVAAWDRLNASGAAQIGTHSPLPLQAQIELAQGSTDTSLWHASATLSGPLEQPALRATLRAKPTNAQRGQSLDARATLRPFDAWPLAELQASTKNLDLSALNSAAPLTALSGDAVAQTSGSNQPARVTVTLANAEPGRWNEGRLPVRQLKLELRARPDDPRTLELQAFDAELGNKQQSAGHVQGQGRWTIQQWTLATTLQSLQPSQLDARAIAVPLSGTLSLVGTGFADTRPEGPSIEIKGDLAGQIAARKREPARPVQLKLDARVNAQRIELRDAQAIAGVARASLAGTASRSAVDAPWQLKGQVALVDFDPLPWWPGREDSPWRKGPHRLNAKGDFDLTLAALQGEPTLLEQAAALRGHAAVALGNNSVVAGVPLKGELSLRSADATSAIAALALDSGGNSVAVNGRLSTAQRGASDQWDATLAAPALNQLAPLWRLFAPRGIDASLNGSVHASARISGRWPDIATRGQLDVNDLQLAATRVQRAKAAWQIDSAASAAIDVQASLERLSTSLTALKGTPPIDSALVRGLPR